MKKIIKGFTDSKGQPFENIDNYLFNAPKDNNIESKLFKVSHEEEPEGFGRSEEDGSYIYRDYNLKTGEIYGVKLYKDFYYCNHYKDAPMISELQNKQTLIKRTEFPTGIVSIDDRVVGQIIPFYDNSNPINKFIEVKKDINLKILYREILEILKELLNAGIIYKDINSGNFLIDEINNCIRLIDFEPFFISFDKTCKTSYDSMLWNLKRMLQNLNEIVNVQFDKSFFKCETLEELEKHINNDENYQLIKK